VLVPLVPLVPALMVLLPPLLLPPLLRVGLVVRVAALTGWPQLGHVAGVPSSNEIIGCPQLLHL